MEGRTDNVTYNVLDSHSVKVRSVALMVYEFSGKCEWNMNYEDYYEKCEARQVMVARSHLAQLGCMCRQGPKL